MRKISGDEALHILSANGEECMIATDTLGYLIEKGTDVDCYRDDDCVIFADRSSEKNLVTVVPLKSSFDLEALKTVLRHNNASLGVWIDTQRLSETFLNLLNSNTGGFLKYERTIEDLMYPSKRPVESVFENVRLLDLDDRDCFIACSTENIANRPPLSMLFDIFVAQKEGFILGAFDNGQIVGYLSFFQMLPGVFDVDYIYVNPTQRGRGVGKSLGNAYVEHTRKVKHIAYWSNAQNDASKATALSCGFLQIRQSNKYTTDLLTE